MTAHEGPIRCAEHGTVADFGCTVRNCDDTHPLTTVGCGDFCASFVQVSE